MCNLQKEGLHKGNKQLFCTNLCVGMILSTSFLVYNLYCIYSHIIINPRRACARVKVVVVCVCVYPSVCLFPL